MTSKFDNLNLGDKLNHDLAWLEDMTCDLYHKLGVDCDSEFHMFMDSYFSYFNNLRLLILELKSSMEC